MVAPDSAAITPAIGHAEPITVFHYEVLTVNDSQVAKLTSQLLYMSFCLVIIAVVNFVSDLHSSTLTLSAAIVNLLVALSLPACGFIGVKDKNVTCIQYFCCCTYVCAFFTFISLISAIVIVASGQTKYALQLALFVLFFMIYLRAGFMSQRLQELPYFTQNRLAPHQSFNVHQNTVESHPQPVAQVEFVSSPPSSPHSTGGYASGGQPAGDAAHSASIPHLSPHSVVVVASSDGDSGGGFSGGGDGSGGHWGSGRQDGDKEEVFVVPVATAIAVLPRP